MSVESPLIEKTLHWIRSFIIKFHICPFAKREIERNTVKIQVTHAKKLHEALEELLIELIFLDNNRATETSFLVFSSIFGDFFDYLDFVDKAELLIKHQGYEGVYQLATFHPNYCFADTDYDDVSNYTNRSPYPMIHMLREDSLDKAIAYYGDTEKIPKNNIITLRKLGLANILKILGDP